MFDMVEFNVPVNLLVHNMSTDTNLHTPVIYTIKADLHIACHAHAVPLPCRAAKDLECVFPI